MCVSLISNPDVDQWTDNRSEEELNEQAVMKEIEKLEKKLEVQCSPPVGSMDAEKGEMQNSYNQLNNASTKTVHGIKMDNVLYFS